MDGREKAPWLSYNYELSVSDSDLFLTLNCQTEFSMDVLKFKIWGMGTSLKFWLALRILSPGAIQK